MSVVDVEFDAAEEALGLGLYRAVAANDVAATDALAGVAKDRFRMADKEAMEGGKEALKACVQRVGPDLFDLSDNVALRGGLPAEVGDLMRTVCLCL